MKGEDCKTVDEKLLFLVEAVLELSKNQLKMIELSNENAAVTNEAVAQLTTTVANLLRLAKKVKAHINNNGTNVDSQEH